MKRSAALMYLVAAVLLCGASAADAAGLIETLFAPTRETGGAQTALVYEAEAYTWNGNVVPDPGAVNGLAVWATPAVHARAHAYVLCSGQDAGLAPAQYTVTFRIKVAVKPESPVRVCRLGAYNHSGVANKPLLFDVSRELTTADFATPGQYQEFSVPLERHDISFAAFMVQWHKQIDIWVDRAVLTVNRFYSDTEMAANPRLQQTMSVTGLTGPPAGRDLLVVAGPFYRHFRLSEALKSEPDTVVDVCRAVRERALAGDYFKPEFPGAKGAAGLAKYRAVLLLDVPATPLHVAGRRALRDYVTAGGGLIVAGGPFAFGKGGYGPTFLQELLPVTDDGPWGLQPARRRGAVTPSKAAGALFAGLFTKDRTVAPWYHRFQARPGATVLLSVEKTPLAVLGAYGNGRVAVLGLTPIGEPAQGDTALLTCADWPAAMARLIEWAGSDQSVPK